MVLTLATRQKRKNNLFDVDIFKSSNNLIMPNDVHLDKSH